MADGVEKLIWVELKSAFQTGIFNLILQLCGIFPVIPKR